MAPILLLLEGLMGRAAAAQTNRSSTAIMGRRQVSKAGSRRFGVHLATQSLLIAEQVAGTSC